MTESNTQSERDGVDIEWDAVVISEIEPNARNRVQRQIRRDSMVINQ